MKRLVFAITISILFFVLLNFVYCNLDDAVFGYKVIFKFNIPYVISLRSFPMPLGFILLISFSIGMIAVALVETLPAFFKTLEIISKNRRIRQLERELKAVRQLSESSYSETSDRAQ